MRSAAAKRALLPDNSGVCLVQWLGKPAQAYPLPGSCADSCPAVALPTWRDVHNKTENQPCLAPGAQTYQTSCQRKYPTASSAQVRERGRSEEHTYETQSLMRISYAV